MAFRFSRQELHDLLIAWIAISFAFANLKDGSFMSAFLISAITVGIGFLLHELAHKMVAQHYGAWAEFRASRMMLLLAVAMSFMGVVFAAPGAVIISGRTIGKSRNGKIAAAGPATNFVLAILFLATLSYAPRFHDMLLEGFHINAWLGLFNMLPFGVLDGRKVWMWSKVGYFTLLIAGVGLVMA